VPVPSVRRENAPFGDKESEGGHSHVTESMPNFTLEIKKENKRDL